MLTTTPALRFHRYGRLRSHQCPVCLSWKVARSARRTLDQWLLPILRWRPYRCLECRHRFYDVSFSSGPR